jgi:arylsulfatase A-like enzyme
MHVPLILAGPGVPSGKRIGAARTVDLVPTVLTLLGRPVPEGLDGRPLVKPAR